MATLFTFDSEYKFHALDWGWGGGGGGGCSITVQIFITRRDETIMVIEGSAHLLIENRSRRTAPATKRDPSPKGMMTEVVRVII